VGKGLDVGSSVAYTGSHSRNSSWMRAKTSRKGIQKHLGNDEGMLCDLASHILCWGNEKQMLPYMAQVRLTKKERRISGLRSPQNPYFQPLGYSPFSFMTCTQGQGQEFQLTSSGGIKKSSSLVKGQQLE
jgi:hypothetical protein